MKDEKDTIYAMPNVGCLIGTAYQRLTSQLDVALKKAGLQVSVAEYLVLRTLYTRDGLQQCEIVDMLGKDKGAVCRTVTALARKGLVSTEQVSHKCLKVWLTSGGQALRASIFAIADERHRALMALAGKREMEVFVKILTKITNE